MKGRRGDSGFSLLEMMMVLLLLATVSGLAMLAMNSRQSSADAGAVATLVAEELRMARERATSEGTVAAVVFPSDGGSTPLSTSLYLLEGQDQPRLVRSAGYAGDARRAVLFNGSWSVDGAAGEHPDTTGRRSSRLDVQRWVPDARASDYYFIFTPDGGVITNGLPSYNGRYMILCAAGVQYSGGGTPSGTSPVTTAPAYFSLVKAAEPWTVVVSEGGGISVEKGVVGAGPDLEVSGTIAMTDVAPTFNVPAGDNSAPELRSLDVLPTPNAATLPVSADAVVEPGGRLTLNVTATDPEGDDLFIDWEADGGKFSFVGEQRMQWNELGYWSSSWDWRPPENGLTGTTYELRCTIRDGRQAVLVPSGSAIKKISLSSTGHVLVERRVQPQPPGASANYLEFCRVSGDGSSEETMMNVTNWWGYSCPQISPDGSKIIYDQNLFDGIWVANIDGSDPKKVVGYGAIMGTISPLGDQIAYWRMYSGSFWLCTANLDGSGELRRVDVGRSIRHVAPSWSPDGERLAFNHYDTLFNATTWIGGSNPIQPEELRVLRLSNNNLTATGIAPTQGVDWGPGSPDWIYYRSGPNLFRVHEDGSDLTDLGAAPGYFQGLDTAGTWALWNIGNTLHRSRVDGSDQQQLTSPHDYYRRATWGL